MPYNLRSSVKVKNAAPDVLSHYKSRIHFNPEVKMEIIELLQNPDNHNNTFYVQRDKLKIKNSKNQRSPIKTGVATFLLGILISFSFLYFNDYYHIKLNSNLSINYQNAQNYCLGFFDSLKNYVKYDEPSKLKVNAIMNGSENLKIELKEMIKESMNNLKNHKNINLKEKSFIVNECGKDYPTDSFNTTIDSPFTDHSFNSTSLAIKNSENNYFTSTVPVDYALYSKGARILSTFDTIAYGIITIKFWNYEFELNKLFFLNFFHSKGPTSILIPWTKPGDCWPFKGSYGRFSIELSHRIFISAVTIDHIRTSTYNKKIDSAPKHFSVIGIKDDTTLRLKRINLGTFEYRISGPSLQTFFVRKSDVHFKIIELIIESNHGNKEYTCLYKIRVHGQT